jgi:hypothetical protein
METFIARAAQSAFNRAGYGKEEAYRQARVVADQMLSQLDAFKASYGIMDELELAYQVGRDVVEYREPIRRRLEAVCQ